MEGAYTHFAICGPSLPSSGERRETQKEEFVYASSIYQMFYTTPLAPYAPAFTLVLMDLHSCVPCLCLIHTSAP